MPIVFTEPFDEYKKEKLGSIIEHEMVKDTYEVTDVFIGKGVGKDYACAVPNFTVKNVRTGETVSCPSSEVNTQPFQFALEGNYTTALTKVEKPEDSAERYGETKLVEDEGVNKYSYKDNIIDILIFGTSEEFHFTLKEEEKPAPKQAATKKKKSSK